jgi:dolichol-phosphate mannosyltransferase
MKKVSILIPCYNEEQSLPLLYNRLAKIIDNQMISEEMKYEWEILFVNDGSKDNTLAVLSTFAEKDKRIKVLNFSRNFGHQCAVSAGLHHCTGDAAAIIDADLQDPPEVIIEMLQIMQAENANAVYGVRKNRKGESWFKLITAKYFYRFLNFISDVKFPVDTGDFRLIDRKIIDAFCGLKENNKYIRGLISWLGFKQVPCYYEREARLAGETKYPIRKMLHFAMIGLFYFSKKPLQLATSLGFFCVLFGILYVIYMFLSFMFGYANLVHGWFSTIVIIIFFGGVQLLTIGILGRYIGNIFDESKNRPEYIIADKINF